MLTYFQHYCLELWINIYLKYWVHEFMIDVGDWNGDSQFENRFMIGHDNGLAIKILPFQGT